MKEMEILWELSGQILPFPWDEKEEFLFTRKSCIVAGEGIFFYREHWSEYLHKSRSPGYSGLRIPSLLLAGFFPSLSLQRKLPYPCVYWVYSATPRESRISKFCQNILSPLYTRNYYPNLFVKFVKYFNTWSCPLVFCEITNSCFVTEMSTSRGFYFWNEWSKFPPPSTKSRRINFCSSVEHNLLHFSGLTRRLLIVKSRMKIIL